MSTSKSTSWSKIETVSFITAVVTEEVTRVDVSDVQGHIKVGTVQGTVTVPTLVFHTVVTVMIVVEGPRSRVVLVYPTTTVTNTTP